MNKKKPPTLKTSKEAGQGFIEYAIILILVGIAVVLVVSLMQPAIGDVFSRFVAQAPVAPPSLLNYTPPPSATNTPTVDPLATDTPVPSNTPVPSETPVPPDTPVPSNTPTPSDTPVPSNTPSPTPCGPYGPFTVSTSGTVRIQAEDFRCGGAGVAFSETSSGPGSGDYRIDVGSEGPDLEDTSDAGGGFNIGWTRNNEWIEYEIESPVTDSFDLTIRHALNSGNSQLSVRTTSVDFGFQDSTPTLTLPSTGGWQNWQNINTQITLYQGLNIVRINILSDSGNYNYFEFTPFVPTATPTPVTPTATPAPTNTPSPTFTPVPVTVTLLSESDEDGHIRESSQGSGVGGNASDNDNIRLGDDNQDRQFVGIVSFDTSSIPDGATITEVQLRLRRRDVNVGNSIFGDSGLGDILVDIAPVDGFSGDTSLEASDFEASAGVVQVTVLTPPLADNAWAQGTLNLTQPVLDNIDLTGTTQFRVYFSLPTNFGNTDRLRFWSSNVGDSADHPQLVITYLP